MSSAPTGTTRVAAVIGSPVRHSLSPVIHNAAFAELGLDWTYLAFDVAAGDARAALRAMQTLHLGGLSVTMPHKADVAAAVDRLTPAAQDLDAVNCVAWDRGELVGHNTDGQGFVDALQRETGVDLGATTCVIVGAGGAARAVIRALALAGAGEVVVVNRTPAKAESAAVLAGAAGRVGRPADAEHADIVVNATSLGMAGTSLAPAMPLEPGLLQPKQIVVDLVYHPLETPFLHAARERGAHAVGGVGMLVHQAGHQFELWTGHEPPLEAMHRAVDKAIAS